MNNNIDRKNSIKIPQKLIWSTYNKYLENREINIRKNYIYSYVRYFFLFLVFSFGLSSYCTAETPLVVNIFSKNNGVGLERSRKILKKELENLGHKIFEKEFHDNASGNESLADINIFFERIVPSWFPYAKRNWLIPNPDYFRQSLELLNQIDLILCRTKESERIFRDLNKKTFYLGFTSYDSLITSGGNKDYSKCIHLAGHSPHKGTKAVLQAWQDFSFLPELTVIHQIAIPKLVQANVYCIPLKLPMADLLLWQNSCGLHLCPSEIEGYGHYIAEGMSTEAVVITTDAPPMNEFITDPRCLVPYESTSSRFLGTNYYVSSEALAKTVHEIMQLSVDERKKIGKRNRAAYLKRENTFRKNLARLMETLGE